jgi:chromosome segregation ATPase
MAEENEVETEPTTEPEQDSVVEETREELKEPNLSLKDLKELEERLEARLQMVAKDKSKDSEDKAILEGQIEKLSERIEHLISAQEERDRKHNDSTTIVVPPKELDQPTHLNPAVPEAQPENPSKSEQKKEAKGWKRLY